MHNLKSSEICCCHSRLVSQSSTDKSVQSVTPWVSSPPKSPVSSRPSVPFVPRWLCMLQRKKRQLTARICQIEVNATSASGGSGSARSWNVLGHSDGSTAAGSLGSHGAGSSDGCRNIRRRLDTFSSPQDEHARSAVLFGFPCELGSKNSGQRPTHLSANLQEYIAKQVPCQPDSYSKQERSVRALWHRTRMMYSLCSWKPILQFHSPHRLKIENWKAICSFGKPYPQSYKISSLKGMRKVPSLSLHSMNDHKSSALRIAETVWWQPVFKLAPLGSEQMFNLTAPDLCVPGISNDILRQIISQASQPAHNGAANVWWALFRLLAVPPLGESRHLFPRFPYMIDLAVSELFSSLLDIFLTQHFGTGKVLGLSAVNCTTPCRVCYVLPCGLASVNPLWRWYNNPRASIWHAAEHCRSTPSHVRKWDPSSWSGMLFHLEDFINPVFHRRGKKQMMNTWRNAHPAPPQLRWRRGCSSTAWKTASPTGQEHACPYSWRRPSMRYLEYEIAYWIPVFSAIFQGKKTQLLHSTYQEQRHRLQAVQVLAPRFRLFGTFIPNNVNANGSAICIRKDFPPEGTIATHLVTCQARPHCELTDRMS